MLKKTISFKDYNGKDCVEEHYFNLTLSELAKAEINETLTVNGEVTGGFREKMEKIVASGRGRDIMEAMEDIVRMTYGVRVDDSKFKKTDELTEDFMQTLAYDALFMELVTDADAASAFIRGTVPAEISAKMDEQKIQDKPNRPYPTAPVKPQSTIDDVIPDPFIPDVSSVVPSESREIVPGLELTREEIAEAIRKRNPGTV